ncbi:TetR family transcriptional regulator [Cricetibacter osteomyelitidis]|uniref:TetR family transcriptional regulator n=1 Tax=Cricetibacter osteomyelitidis TaxID=1521931 RepID=A0A4R2T6L5_9PAST|nr:TetR/AcrR family transcriptional regulator [Cricetibacter osteomyelitidis]TCP97271.1 TetR family transcriptional regulator [Cricetibacter osteomyelitidis]
MKNSHKSTGKIDLRVVKTHKYIRQALVDLLQIKGFREITVDDILQTAMVNRTTFYRYYSGKSDLAGKMIADVKILLDQTIKQRLSCTNLSEFYQYAVPVLFQERQTFLALWKIDTPRHHLYQDMRSIIKVGAEKIILQKHPHIDAEQLDFQSTMMSALLLESIRYHFERNIIADPKKVLASIHNAISTLDF